MIRSTVVLLTALLSGAAFASEVLVFTDSAHPVRNTGEAKVIFLDRVDQLEKDLSVGLPGNEDDAERVALDRLQSPEGQRKIEEMVVAYHGLMQAWQMGVSKIPAVVVDGRYVVYGQPDVQLAIARIAEGRVSSGGLEMPTDTRPRLITGPHVLPLTPKEEREQP